MNVRAGGILIHVKRLGISSLLTWDISSHLGHLKHYLLHTNPIFSLSEGRLETMLMASSQQGVAGSKVELYFPFPMGAFAYGSIWVRQRQPIQAS